MITDKQRELETSRRESVVRVVGRLQACLAGGGPTIDANILERHPLASFIQRVALREGPGSKAVVMAVNEILRARVAHDARRLREGKMIGMQCAFVLPVRDTRDAMLGLDSIEENTLESILDDHASAVVPLMPEWWRPYVAIATSYTAVTIEGRAAPARFSGTYSDAFGAVHGAIPATAEVYVEVLTHEAGHLWLNLVAEQDSEFIRNPYSQQSFVSPWRNDARPIHGIFHGAYVFSVVVPALLAMRTESARARSGKLAVEVRDALRQVKAYGMLSEEALDIAQAAEARVKQFEKEIGAEILAASSAKYANDKELKVRRLKEEQSDIRVTWERE